MTKILIEIDTDTQRVVPKTLTSEMKANIEHQWSVGSAIDMAQREWDGALAVAPQPKPVDVEQIEQETAGAIAKHFEQSGIGGEYLAEAIRSGKWKEYL